jgi:hypothetical protein
MRQTLSPPLFMYPEGLDLATTPPGPAIETSNDVVLMVAKENREQPAIRDPGLRNVVLIDAVIKKLDVMKIWLLKDGEPPRMQ